MVEPQDKARSDNEIVFDLAGILVLLALLVQKELANAAQGQRFHSLSQALNIGIAPLLIAFAVVA